MATRPPSELLEELGWLVVGWSGLESVVELSCAYIYRTEFNPAKDKAPPKPFKTRIRFIRKAVQASLFAHLRADYEAALQTALELGEERNDRIHGVFTNWSATGTHLQTVLKSSENGYVAIQDIGVTRLEVAQLSERIRDAFWLHFNLLDRLKSLIRAYEGGSDVSRRMLGGVE